MPRRPVTRSSPHSRLLMPKLPRTSAQKIIRTLKTLGFVVLRQQGSHVILRRGNRGCVVPMHKEVAVGTLRGVLRQADLSPEEFMEAFN